MFGSWGHKKKDIRFGKPEFQEKLARARQYQRKSVPVKSQGILAPLRRWGGFSKTTFFFVFLLALAAVYFLTISKMFLVSSAVLVNDSAAYETEIRMILEKMQSERVYFVPKNHILFLSKDSFQEEIQNDWPQIREVSSFRKVLPNSLEVAVQTREPKYVWQSGSQYFLLDQDGVVFQEIFNYDPAVYSEDLISDQTSFSVNFGEDLEVRRLLGFVEEIKNNWVNFVEQTKYESFAVPGKKSPDVFVRTTSGFQVYFDLQRSAAAQLENLNLVLNSEIDPATYSGLSYIDLRLSNIAYYCYKDAPCAPEYSTSTVSEL